MPSFITSVPYPQIPASFNYVGSNQNFVVPAGVTRITVYMWGAGGGGTTTQYGATLGPGGTGAFVTGQISVTPGQTLYVLVGQGGGGMQGYFQTKLSPGGFPGGGNGYYAPGGGGYSGIFTSSTPSQSNALIVAGAGGGAVVDGHTYGGSATNVLGTAQNGGNRNNGNETTTPGLGATATGGGAGGTPPPVGFGTGSAGAALKGGDGCTTDTSANNYGGGGGAGYWGGGGGSSFGGGGGGNSYANSTYVTNFTGASTQSSLTTAVSAPGSNNPYYQAGIAASAAGQNGGNGLVVITYPKPPTGSLQTFLTKQVYPSVSPASIPGLVLWLDGADPAGNGVIPSAGATVSPWVEKTSGNNATVVGTPTYTAGGGITFNGSTYMYNLNFAQNLSQRSVFIVVKENVHNNFAGIFPLIPNPTTGADYTSTNGLDFETNATQFTVTGNSVPQYLGPNGSVPKAIYNDNMSNTTGSGYYNGSNQTNYTTSYTMGTCSGYGVGARWTGSTDMILGLNGVIYEILYYNQPLSSNNRTTVHAYLANKWGLTSSLPAGHPTSAAIIPTGVTVRTASSVAYIDKILYSSVALSDWTNVWQPYLQKLAAANSGATVTVSNLAGGGAAYAGQNGWSGGVLAPNGNIYFTPFDSGNILVLNPTTGATSNLYGGATYTSAGWQGGVLAANGNIYSAPYGANNILVLNPTTGFTSNLYGGATYTQYGWWGGVVGPNGNIYFSPVGANNILVLNPTTGVTSNLYGGATYGSYNGCVLAPNGNIYFSPNNAGNILVLNPTTGITSNMSNAAISSGSWWGGVLAPNGNIYFAPVGTGNILALNPNTGAISKLTGGAAYSGIWVGGALGPDGNIYFIPWTASNVLVLNPTTGVTSNLTGTASFPGYAWETGVVGPNGNIYCAPWSSGNILKISFSGLTQLPNSNYFLSPYVNKA